MFLRNISIFFVFILTTIGAFAAERAEFDLIGYSPDGKYFAFEEYGIQDGSGFAYSSVYVLDVDNDSWVGDSPYRAHADDENTALRDIRQAALEAAFETIISHDISHPARLIALNGDGEPEADELTLDFGLPGYAKPDSRFGDYELSFEIYDAPSGEDCMGYFGDKAKGFRLLFTEDDAISIVHEDSRIPKSRGCPVTYRASAVIVPFEATDISRAVTLISVWTHGYEGLDRRFIAIPLAADGE